MKKRSLSESVKKQIAFAQQYKCKKCDVLLPSSYQIDHVIPHSVSNDDSEQNLMSLCPNCHASKSQTERSRIIYYKKIKAETKSDICYFCLQVKDNFHNCSKEYLKIPKQNKTFNEVTEGLYRYANIPIETVYDKLSKLSLTKQDNILRINITKDFVYINNFFTHHDRDNLTPHELGKLVKEVLKEDKYKYSSVEIDIDIENNGGEGAEKAISYFSSLLPDEMPRDIFNNSNPSYIYYYE